MRNQNSGPTRLLPFSQMFDAGYLAYRRAEFEGYFLRNQVSVPLNRGDAVFINPAVHHAAGENRTQNVRRSANLLQVSGAFGKTMENIDPLVEKRWDLLMERSRNELVGCKKDGKITMKRILLLPLRQVAM